MKIKEIRDCINQAIAENNQEKLKTCAYEIESANLRSNRFIEGIFKIIINLMKNPKFLELEGTSNLIVVLEHDWDILSDSQKERLLPALENAYGKFKDWMSWFIISEIFGEYYNNDQAFRAICRLKTLKAEGPRSLLVHGLEHITKSSNNKILSRKAFKELLNMNNDPSENVKKEVLISLQRLKRLDKKCQGCQGDGSCDN